MPHHHPDENEMVGAVTTENTSSTRHSHGHIHLKPTVVFDHIKTKVKRKRSTNNVSAEIPGICY